MNYFYNFYVNDYYDKNNDLLNEKKNIIQN